MSPRSKARIAGVLYFCAMGAALALFVRSTLVVRGDAVATAHNIQPSELLLRFGFTADLLAVMAYAGVTAILYELLKPVSRTLSLAAAFFSLAGVAISALNLVNYLAPVFLLRDAERI